MPDMTAFGAAKEISPVVNKIASERDIRATFNYQHDQLFWMARLITADEEAATEAIRNASAMSTASGHAVFHDWLVQWVKSNTIRNAAALVRHEIKYSAEQFKHMQCEHGGHAPLSHVEVDCIRRLDRDDIPTLDTLARTVLVFRGMQHASVGDCALFLGVSRAAVNSAYCRSLAWFHTHCMASVDSGPRSSRIRWRQ